MPDEPNSHLISLASNFSRQADIIKVHLPFGAHQSNIPGGNEQLLFQGGYISLYDIDLRTALWVSYRLTEDDIRETKGKKRVNCFRPDPRFDSEDSAAPADYKEAIFDQGHMANDADLKDDFIQ